MKVDGVYGQHTYAGVVMFQLKMNLQPTGAVDAVTLDKLEPMISHHFPLDQVIDALDVARNPSSAKVMIDIA